ncbi:Fibronectin type III domain protein [compost metagenome]
MTLDTDVVGTLGMQHLSVQVWLGKPGQTGLFRDPKLGDRLVYVKTPDDETYLFYDLTNEGRLDHTITIRAGVAAWETLLYGPYINSTGATETVMLGTEKTEYDATDDIIRKEIEKVTAPDQVKGIAASDPQTGGSIEVTWAANVEHDLAGYNVYISTNSGTTWAKVNTTGLIPDLVYVVGGLIDGNTYWFKVTAVDTTGYESIDSAVVYAVPTLLDTIPPAKPASLNALGGNGLGSVQLSWAGVADADLATYALYRSPTGIPGSFLKIATINQPTTTYTDTGGIVAGSDYYYYVTAVDTTGNESDASGTVMATA